MHYELFVVDAVCDGTICIIEIIDEKPITQKKRCETHQHIYYISESCKYCELYICITSFIAKTIITHYAAQIKSSTQN